MKVKASDQQIEGVAAQLKADHDIVSYRFLDHNAAYDVFKRLFADQPVLIQNQTPEALPESFRLTVRDRRVGRLGRGRTTRTSRASIE